MAEFWNSYGTWIVVGLFFLLMLALTRRGSHGLGSGCCGGQQTEREKTVEKESSEKSGSGCH